MPPTSCRRRSGTGFGAQRNEPLLLQLRRQVAQLQHRPRRQRAGAFDGVLQLPHIARPVVQHHGAQGLVAQRELGPALAADAIEKVRRQQGNVFAAVAQRRQAQVDHVEPVKQVLAKGSLLHHLRQVAVGGGHDARLDGHAVGGAHRPHFLLLQGAQQLGLQIERELADLVEKDRAALRRNQQPVFRPVGAGESALHIAEQLALDQRRHQRPAIDGQKRLLRIGPVGVDGPGHQLLAGAAFAQHQHRVRALRDFGKNAVELLHFAGAADDGAQALREPEPLAQLARGECRWCGWRRRGRAPSKARPRRRAW